MSDRLLVDQPLVVMYEQDDQIVCRIWPRAVDSHRTYGLLVADLVRHVARAFNVEEDEIWEWVDKERRRPTTNFSSPS